MANFNWAPATLASNTAAVASGSRYEVTFQTQGSITPPYDLVFVDPNTGLSFSILTDGSLIANTIISNNITSVSLITSNNISISGNLSISNVGTPVNSSTVDGYFAVQLSNGAPRYIPFYR